MKRFLKTTIISLFALLILLVGLDVFISKKLQKSPSRPFMVWNEIMTKNPNTDAVILGSSRACFQYSPQILDSIVGISFYNLGINAGRFNRQLLRYNVYCQYNKTPKLIVINIDQHWPLSKSYKTEREQFFPFLYYSTFRKAIEGEPFSFAEKYIPFFRYYGYTEALKHAIGFKTQYYDDSANCNLYKGYIGRELNYDGNELKEVTEYHFECDENVKKMFVDFVGEAKRENIKVIFVFAPMYFEAIQKCVDLEEMHATYNAIATEFSVPILDYTFLPISYDTTYFYDATHLNKTGAELFSTQLAHDLEALLIEN